MLKFILWVAKQSIAFASKLYIGPHLSFVFFSDVNTKSYYTGEGMQKEIQFAHWGFNTVQGSPHTARTMMLEELRILLDHVRHLYAEKNEYQTAICDENCLAKRSNKTRKLSYKHLVELYSLDNTKILFRALLYFWNRDMAGRPLLALLCAYARDPLLRSTTPCMLRLSEGSPMTRESLEDFIDTLKPSRFRKTTLRSTAANLCSTWTKSGHLAGRVKKIRSRSRPTAGSVAYALFLGYLTGARGQTLFQTEYAKLLDCSLDKSVEFAEEASRKGWLVFKRVGNVMEVLFPNLITQEEWGWICEQN